jgi:phospholipid/cholesterol/gamma-HCH transport system permease protein
MQSVRGLSLNSIPVYVGRRAITLWAGVRDFTGFVWSIVVSFRSLRYLKIRSIYNIIINQTRFTGIDALLFVVIIALLIGATVIIQATTNLPKFGVEGFIGNLLVVIVARELGPLVTALIVIARSGSAIASEIATQTWSREILSMEILGIDARLFIVFPRIIASILSILSLIVIFDVVAFSGGYLISQATVYIPVDEFIQNILDAFTFKDLIAALIKSVIFGMMIPVICCYYGFKPKSKFEIPIFVSRAVIRTLLAMILINAIVSVFFYL